MFYLFEKRKQPQGCAHTKAAVSLLGIVQTQQEKRHVNHKVKCCDNTVTFLNPYKPGVLLWDIGKQNSPDVTPQNAAILFADMNFIEQ